MELEVEQAEAAEEGDGVGMVVLVLVACVAQEQVQASFGQESAPEPSEGQNFLLVPQDEEDSVALVADEVLVHILQIGQLDD